MNDATELFREVLCRSVPVRDEPAKSRRAVQRLATLRQRGVRCLVRREQDKNRETQRAEAAPHRADLQALETARVEPPGFPIPGTLRLKCLISISGAKSASLGTWRAHVDGLVPVAA